MKAWCFALAFAAAVSIIAPAMAADATGGAGKNGTALSGSQANLAAAQSKLNSDKDKLDEMLQHREDIFENSKEYKDAKQAVDDALAADKAAKDAVLAKLAPQPSYAAAKARADAADAAAKGGSPDQAQRALDADGVVTKIENAALSSDDGVKAADAKLKAAEAALKQLKDDNDMKMKYDDHMVAQRDAIAKDQRELDAWAARVRQLQSQKKK